MWAPRDDAQKQQDHALAEIFAARRKACLGRKSDETSIGVQADAPPPPEGSGLTTPPKASQGSHGVGRDVERDKPAFPLRILLRTWKNGEWQEGSWWEAATLDGPWFKLTERDEKYPETPPRPWWPVWSHGGRASEVIGRVIEPATADQISEATEEYKRQRTAVTFIPEHIVERIKQEVRDQIGPALVSEESIRIIGGYIDSSLSHAHGLKSFIERQVREALVRALGEMAEKSKQ